MSWHPGQSRGNGLPSWFDVSAPHRQGSAVHADKSDTASASEPTGLGTRTETERGLLGTSLGVPS